MVKVIPCQDTSRSTTTRSLQIQEFFEEFVRVRGGATPFSLLNSTPIPNLFGSSTTTRRSQCQWWRCTHFRLRNIYSVSGLWIVKRYNPCLSELSIFFLPVLLSKMGSSNNTPNSLNCCEFFFYSLYRYTLSYSILRLFYYYYYIYIRNI